MDNGQLKVVSPLKGTPAYKAGILAGDKIIKIDGESTVGITLMEAVSLIRGPVDTEVRLLILRDDKEIEKNIIRGAIVIPTAELTFLEDGKIAHIELFSFRKGTFEQLEKIANSIAKSNATSIILDLRNNPGGFLHSAVQISGLFLEQNSIVVIQDKRDKEIISRTSRWRNPTLKDYNMVILVNGGTASASEILAGALNYHRDIKLIGETTIGKGSVQELKELSDGSMLKITIAYWLLPNRDRIEGDGLVPDIELKNSIEKLTKEIDCQLNKAIEKLNPSP
jgi:carboxyl-terminal processing protease